MLAKVQTGAVIGLEGSLVHVEVDIGRGLPAFAIVGLPDVAVNEAKERVRSAIRNSGGTFPIRRITVNLAPADLRKAGPSYDLPIAVGILLASDQLVSSSGDERLRAEEAGDADENIGVPLVTALEDCLFLGELSLDGSVRHVRGVLPMVALAQDLGLRAIFVPAADAPEAALLGNKTTIYPVSHLAELAAHLRGDQLITPYPLALSIAAPMVRAEEGYTGDLADVRGQEHVKRALEVAAAGGHNILLWGAPGSGKTLLARTLASILPPLTTSEALETTKLYSVAGLLMDGVEVPRVAVDQLMDRSVGERSEVVRARVTRARARQAERFAGRAHLSANADMGPGEVTQYCDVEPSAEPLLRLATERLQLSARSFHRVLKLARTIADLAESETIGSAHVAEALQYRPRLQPGVE